MHWLRRCVSRAFFAGILLGAWGLGGSGAMAFTTGGTLIYNTATAVYADANNVMIKQAPVCKQAASITAPVPADKPAGAGSALNDRVKPSPLTQSAGSQTPGKAAPHIPPRAKVEPPC